MTDTPTIQLRGVRVHNLKNVDLDLPQRRFTVFTGVSGSGKSSLAFDTLYAEAQRRYLQSFSAYTRQFLERLDKPDADRLDNLPPAVAVGQRFQSRGPRATVGTLTEAVDYLRLLFARAGVIYCLHCGQEVRAAAPADVVAAALRLPAGTRFSVAFPAKPESDVDARAWAEALREEGFLRVQVADKVVRLDEDPLPALQGSNTIFVLVDRLEAGRVPLQRLTDSIETAFARGQGRMVLLTDATPLPFDQRLRCPRCDIEYPPLEPRLFSFNDPLGACLVCEGTGEAKKEKGKKRKEKEEEDEAAGAAVCPSCHGIRLNHQALAVRVAGKTIADLCALPVKELATFCEAACGLADDVAKPQATLLLGQILSRLGYLNAVELGYLSLDRAARTLSTGESQRVRLTTALGSNLAGALYVLDEPTAGLHPRDTEKLLAVLLRLRAGGNTLIVVEHDVEMIRAADHLVELGPGAGEEGGRVVYQGPPAGIVACEESPTGAFLSGRRRIAVPSRRRDLSHGTVRVVGARTHNLRDLTVEFPLGVLCVVTGVSGAGKSALVQETLYPALCRRLGKKGPAVPQSWQDLHGGGALGDVLLMDQAPLARTVRSNPATYIKVFDAIREVFAETAEARARRLDASAFSFNQPGGRCETCSGLGTLTVDMQFLADVTVTCPECGGTRYQREVLDVKVRSLSIAEVLDLTAREAFRFFRAHPAIERRLKLLLDVGLDYIRLGQSANTLSGGESQRLKLAGHLAASRKPRCLFLLDEPTTGLHTADVVRLLDCFDRLLETGHSLIVVEHDLDVIKCADHVIDLGPGAGAEGGMVVAAGTPEEVAAVEASHTGRWLRRALTGP
ncbi:MAG TPA: excinuclease ABC subunit UvrA [Gemmataceae bacterium]|nr:excinuclease ABC subunit UvrA [Gemmataceae bacterium]